MTPCWPQDVLRPHRKRGRGTECVARVAVACPKPHSRYDFSTASMVFSMVRTRAAVSLSMKSTLRCAISLSASVLPW